MNKPLCNFCKTPLVHTFVDLGMAPMVSAYLSEEQLQKPEPFYPLHAYVCANCLLVQLPEMQTPEQIFGDYPYLSSCSKSWLVHIQNYVNYMVKRFGFNKDSQIVEIASNDGYLLQYFKAMEIPVLGIEPAGNIAKISLDKGIPTLNKFFGVRTAEDLVGDGIRADLLLGNNVLAHVPDINDFVAGMKLLLAPGGIITMEFPHLLRTMAENQFDQVFHEHCSYISFIAVEEIFRAHGMRMFDVEELPTHGGSIRIFACHEADKAQQVSDNVVQMREKEHAAGLGTLEAYSAFAEKARSTKRKLLELLIRLKNEGKTIAGYGAPGKGCVLLNYMGIRTDFLEYTVDINTQKQGLYMPGVHVPILDPGKIMETRPDYVLILPWNLKDEIMNQLSAIRDWGGRFIVPIPEARICQ
jgi:hypothetical protein